MFVPNMQRVTSSRHRRNGELTLFIGNGKVLAGEYDHHCAHLRMNVAEDVGDPFAIKVDGARRARFVKSKVKALAVEQGKDVVKPGVKVGKIHGGSFGDHEHVKFKHLVLLLQDGMYWGRWRGAIRVGPDGSEPHHGGIRGRNLCRSLQNHATVYGDGLSPQGCGHAAMHHYNQQSEFVPATHESL